MIKILTIFTKKHDNASPDTTLTLDYVKRQKCKQRVVLDSGEDAGVLLPRGTVLGDGDILQADNGLLIKVCAANEKLSVASCPSQNLFARACYHLGNRHAAAQIEQQTIYYQQDHVLDDMLSRLGLTVQSLSAPFFPENGAYHQHGNHGHR